MLPPLGVSRSAMMRISVVLPQPEGPMSETNSPRPIDKSMSARACTGVSPVEKVRDNPWMSIATGGAGFLSPWGEDRGEGEPVTVLVLSDRIASLGETHLP